MKNYELDDDDAKKVEEWDCSTLKDFSAIAVYVSNWSSIFEGLLVRPEDVKKSKKEEKIAWIKTLESELNKLSKASYSSYSVSKDMFEMINSIHKWLC